MRPSRSKGRSTSVRSLSNLSGRVCWPTAMVKIAPRRKPIRMDFSPIPSTLETIQLPGLMSSQLPMILSVPRTIQRDSSQLKPPSPSATSTGCATCGIEHLRQEQAIRARRPMQRLTTGIAIHGSKRKRLQSCWATMCVSSITTGGTYGKQISRRTGPSRSIQKRLILQTTSSSRASVLNTVR